MQVVLWRRLSQPAQACCRAALVVLILAGMAEHTYAVDRFWNVGTGLWSQSANWSPAGIPQPADSVFLGYFGNGTSGLSRLNTDQVPAVTAASVYNGGTLLIANGGSLLIGTDLVLGRNSTHGTLNITNPNPVLAFFGGMTVVQNVRLGVLSGVGHVNQNAGTFIVGTSLIVGDSRETGSAFNPAGNYALNGNGYLRSTTLRVGANTSSSGTFNLSGFAELRVQDMANIGYSPFSAGSGTGTFALSGFAQMHVQNLLSVGGAGTTFTQSGGSLTVLGETLIAGGGRFTLSGGAYDSPTVVSANGTFLWSGGTFAPRTIDLFQNGRFIVAEGAGKLLETSYLWMPEPDAVLDLNDNSLRANLFHPHPRLLLQSGYAGGAWTGKGITSSTAAAVAAANQPRTGLGYSLDAAGVNIKYTLMGDANLDGMVNLTDFNRLAANFGQTGRVWVQGDFNYDGIVNLGDFNILAANFGLSAAGPEVTPQDWANLAAAVPEPSAGLLLVAAGVGAMRRRRH